MIGAFWAQRRGQNTLARKTGLAVAGVALTAVALSACGGDMCKNAIQWRTASPDGRFEAVVFQRDCGATTGISTQVSIVSAGQSLPDASGNVMVSDDPFPATAQWKDSVHLIVLHDRAARLPKRATRYKGIMIDYQNQPQAKD